MSDYFLSRSRAFSNRREWRDYLTAAQCAVAYPRVVAYPKIVDALKRGRDWLAQATEEQVWTKTVQPLGHELANDIAAASGLDGVTSLKTVF